MHTTNLREVGHTAFHLAAAKLARQRNRLPEEQTDR